MVLRSTLAAVLSLVSTVGFAQTYPDTSDGRPIMQLGIQGFDNNFVTEEAFTNVALLMGNSWSAEGGSEPPRNYAALWKGGFIERSTNIPRAIPAGYKRIRSGLFRDGRHYPAHYAGTYVLEWEGDADLQFGFGLPKCPQAGKSCQTRLSRNRAEATFVATDRTWSNFEITRIGGAGLRDIRLYRKKNEAHLKAGGMFNPQFIAYARRYKIIRTLDVQSASVSTLRSVDGLKKAGMFGHGGSWRMNKDAPAAPIGAPLATLFRLTIVANSALWMHVPPYLGAPASYDTLPNSETRAYAKANFGKIASSPEWRKWADETVRALKSSGYATNRTLYIELANETWNNAGPFWKTWAYYLGLGDALGNKSSSYSLGYLSAHYAVQFDAALKAQGRSQAWVIVLAGQMANPGTTKAALDGFRRYFSDKRIDPAPYLRRAGVSTASYYSDTFTKTHGLFTAANETELKAKWLAAITSDPAGLARKIEDRLVNGSDQKIGTIPFLVRMRKLHQKNATDAGAFFLGDYEGGSHDQTEWLNSDPRIVNFVENFRRGAHGERVDRAWIEAMRRQNPKAVIANYRGVSLGDPEGANGSDKSIAASWDDGFYNDPNGRTRALDSYLRR